MVGNVSFNSQLYHVLISLLIVASLVTLVITIIIMKKLKKNKAKHEKNLTAFIYKNSGVHPESTERIHPHFTSMLGYQGTHLIH